MVPLTVSRNDANFKKNVKIRCYSNTFKLTVGTDVNRKSMYRYLLNEKVATVA